MEFKRRVYDKNGLKSDGFEENVFHLFKINICVWGTGINANKDNFHQDMGIGGEKKEEQIEMLEAIPKQWSRVRISGEETGGRETD